MANKERGEVSILVKGRSLTLRPNLNALCALEERYGKSASDIMYGASQGNMSATRQLLWAYLQKYHADEFQTMEQVGNMVDDVGLDEINRQLSALQDANQPPEGSVAAESVGGADRPH